MSQMCFLSVHMYAGSVPVVMVKFRCRQHGQQTARNPSTCAFALSVCVCADVFVKMLGIHASEHVLFVPNQRVDLEIACAMCGRHDGCLSMSLCEEGDAVCHACMCKVHYMYVCIIECTWHACSKS
jgi:hypothetical protein